MTILQLLELLAGTGPSGYTAPLRQNLGMDLQFGGAKPTSGMTGAVPVGTGYTPRPVRPDPLVPILKQMPLPKPVVKPVAKPVTTVAPTSTTRAQPGYVWVTGGDGERQQIRGYGRNSR